MSRESLEIGGYKAVKAVVEYPDQGSKAFKLFIRKDERVIDVSFVTPMEEFEKGQPAIEMALEFVKIDLGLSGGGSGLPRG